MMRVCLSCPMARPVFEPQVSGPFGGSEVRASIFAQGLAAAEVDVRVVVQAHDRCGQRQCGGVTLHYVRMPAPRSRTRERSAWQRVVYAPSSAGGRLWRSVVKRLDPHQATRRLHQQLDAADADVYGCFGVHEHAAHVIRFAQRKGRPSLLFLASDTDLSEHHLPTTTSRNAYRQSHALCYEVLMGATQIVAQTQAQQRHLAERFGRSSVLIRNPVPPLDSQPTDMGGTKHVLWVGRADCFSKRADLAIDVARRCPQIAFTFVMNRRDPQVFASLIRQLPSNVHVVPAVPYDEIGAYFDAAHWLLNTSDEEGFPNTFLQAAQRGVPIASLNVDPEAMLSRHGCGICAEGDIERLIGAVSGGGPSQDELASMKRAGPAYVRQFHAAHERCRELIEALSQGGCIRVNGTGPARSRAECEVAA